MRIETHTRRRFGADEEDVAGWRVLRVTGEVNAASGGLLSTLVLYAVRRGASRVCVDLSALEDVDAGGAQALRRCARVVESAGGRLAVVGPSDRRLSERLAPGDVPLLADRDELLTTA
jgi:anti-anti-sigma regulatory factor